MEEEYEPIVVRCVNCGCSTYEDEGQKYQMCEECRENLWKERK